VVVMFRRDMWRGVVFGVVFGRDDMGFSRGVGFGVVFARDDADFARVVFARVVFGAVGGYARDGVSGGVVDFGRGVVDFGRGVDFGRDTFGGVRSRFGGGSRCEGRDCDRRLDDTNRWGSSRD